jgi:hypothetical protein
MFAIYLKEYEILPLLQIESMINLYFFGKKI